MNVTDYQIEELIKIISTPEQQFSREDIISLAVDAFYIETMENEAEREEEPK